MPIDFRFCESIGFVFHRNIGCGYGGWYIFFIANANIAKVYSVDCGVWYFRMLWLMDFHNENFYIEKYGFFIAKNRRTLRDWI